MIKFSKLLLAAVIIIGTSTIVPDQAHAGSQIKGISLGDFSPGCDYYLIQISYGDYSLVEWYGGTTPDSGHVVLGDLHSYGFKNLYDLTNDRETRVWIDDWLLSEDRATEKLIDKCGWDKNILSYFSGTYGTYSPPSYNTPTHTPVATCPANSHENPLNTDKCLCDLGYAINIEKTACVPQIPQAPPTIACKPGFTTIDGQCVCPNDSYIGNNGDCKIASIPSPRNTSATKAQNQITIPTVCITKNPCACVAGYQPKGNSSCVPKLAASSSSKVSSTNRRVGSSSSSSKLPSEVACTKLTREARSVFYDLPKTVQTVLHSYSLLVTATRLPTHKLVSSPSSSFLCIYLPTGSSLQARVPKTAFISKK